MVLPASCWCPGHVSEPSPCPVGVSETNIEIISAKESVIENMPKQTTTSIQIPPAGPPLKREIPIPL
jgi:hypothetical protein